MHERYLRSICSDKRSSNDGVLEKNWSVSIHPRSIQVLSTEICKVKNDLSPNIFNYLCQTETNPYNRRILHDFEVPFVKTVYHGSESISYLALKIWKFFQHQKKKKIRKIALKSLKNGPLKQVCLCKSYIPLICNCAMVWIRISIIHYYSLK